MDNSQIIYELNSPSRLDNFLSTALNLSRSNIKNMIDKGLISVNDKQVKAGKLLKLGDTISITETENTVPLDCPIDIPINIVYEDEHFAVIDKQQGLTVHGGAGITEPTLVNGLLFHLKNLSGINGVNRPGIVHRIDKMTSGLLVVAKNDNAHVNLQAQIQSRNLSRIYLALLEGELKQTSGKIETYIDRSTTNRTMMAVSFAGRKAITNFELIQTFNGYSLVKFKLDTGRTHQIRVHAKHIGHPVVGDTVYGFKHQKFDTKGQLLHATKLTLNHPTTGEYMEFTSPLPPHFSAVLEKLVKK